MASTIDQKTYLLNKYLKAPLADKKKKRKKHVKGTGLRIIDDDVDVSRLRPLEPEELEALAGDEDAPQVAGIVDERPEHVRKMEQFSSSSKWRVVAQDDGFDSKIRVEEIKKNVAQMKEDDNPVFGKMYSDSEDDKKNDSDLSPPRKTTTKPTTSSHSDKSKNKQIHRNSDSDLSPLRIKSPRKSDSDQSPPRKAVTQIIKEDKSQKIKSSSEHSKKRRNSSDSDLSPPRKNDTRKPKDRPKKASRWGHFGPEESSQSQNRDHYKAQDSDQSPPRKAKRSVSPEATSKGQSRSSGSRRDNLESPAHRKSRKSSPPRQRGSDSDLSPPRKSAFTKKRDRSKDSDLSPPRKSRDGNSSKNRSPERRKPPSWRTDEGSGSFKERSRENDGRRNGAERGSQFREGGKGRDNYRENRNKSESPPPSNKKMAKTLEGKTAGLQDARQLQRENEEFRRREDELYARMSGDASGRDATTVNRRLGKRESSAEKEKKKEDKEKQKALEEKYSKWGKGLKQVAEQQARVEDYVHEASKPLARHRDDADLERTLRSVERAGDPMLEYMRGKRADNVEVAERPTYKGNWPPNRFNIRPGHRWDGVDRSNGYEVRYFEQRSKAKAVAVEAYKWSTEDL